MRRILAVAAAGAAIALGVSVPASPAAAHAELVSSQPASGEVLDTAPAEVVLEFTEGVQVGDDAVELFASAGDQIDVGETTTSDGGAVVTVAMPALDDGAYVVTWRVTSADSHPIRGAFTFRVGAAAGDADEADALMTRLVADEGGDTTVGVVYGAVRFLGFAGMVLLVGGAIFLAVLWPAGRGDPTTRRLVVAGWLVFAVTTVLSLGLQGAYAAAEPLSGAVDLSLVGDVIGTRAGVVWLVRLALLAVVGLAGWRLLPRPRRAAGTGDAVAVHASDLSAAARVGPTDEVTGSGATDLAEDDTGVGSPGSPGAGSPVSGVPATPGLGARFPILGAWHDDPTRVLVAGVLAVTLLATVSLAGHAGTGRLAPLALVLDVAHLAGVSFWLGGLVLLVATVLRSPTGATPGDGQDGAPARPATIAQVTASFSTLAFAAVIVIAVTGTVQGWRQIGPLSALTDTTYGRLLIAKVLLVAATLAAAALSRRWVNRRLRPDDGSAAPGDGSSATKALRRSVGAEVLIAGAVLAVTALLVNTVPGVDAATDGAFETEAHGTDLLVLVEVDPASTGPADIRLTTTTHDRQPTEAEEVAATLTLPAREIGPLPLSLERIGEGRYIARDTEIPFPGTWQLEVDARLSEFDQDTITAEIPIG